MQVIRVISGDNELSALDFQKHYRMPIVHLMDPDRAFEKKHNRDGWPFLLLADSEGQIIYKCNNLVDRDKELNNLFKKIEEKSFAAETMTADGVSYMKATFQRNGENKEKLKNERFTSIAAGSDGEIYTVFTSVKNGNSDIIMRISGTNSPDRDIPIAATDADEYDGTVMVDNRSRVWVCWTSNAIDNIYQIHLTCLKDLEDGKKSILVSKSEEDSMHGRMTADDSGNIWITYYRWLKMGQNSRDKEIYLRKFSDGTFSDEIHISPSDVPEYEDHTDPSITMLDNQVIVSWSWDFHRPKGYTQDAREPTIFARTVKQDLSPGKLFLVSGNKIDSAPVMSKVHDKKLWCAWDSLGYNRKSRANRKDLYMRQLNAANSIDRIITIAENLVNVCSPCFAFGQNDKGVLTWSQTENGKDWSLWKSQYDAAKNSWTQPTPAISEGNPRFGSCVYDTQGRLWIAYSAQTDKGREIIVKKSG